MIINLNAGGQLTVSDAYPTAAKTKSCYFIRKAPLVSPKEEMQHFRDNLVYGDLSHQPLEMLITYIEDVRMHF